MKKYLNFFKLFGVLALLLALSFSITACKENEEKYYIISLPEDIDLSRFPLSPAFTTPQSFNNTNAITFVQGMKLGWNLGNTFDAHAGNGQYRGSTSVATLETQWVSAQTTQANINAIKNAGFDTIRIPVSWHQVANPANDYRIRDDWMQRVTTVVNYAYNQGMYVIINTHHDESIFKFQNNNYSQSLVVFQIIWMQIAAQFQNYGERLIFEGLNEPRTKGSSTEWRGGTAQERTNINKYHQAFVDVVRASGGNNDKRFLMIATYAASVEAAALNDLRMPNDPGNSASRKLILSVHYYSPYDFALNTNNAHNAWSSSNTSHTSPITDGLACVRTRANALGVPAIMGEMGAMCKNNEPARAAWADYFVTQARSRGIVCIWWDNGATTGDGERFGLLNRSTNTFHYPQILNGLKKGAGI